MKVTITIDCDNAAFEDMPGHEVARILRKLAADVSAYQDRCNEIASALTLRDVNGNAVGRMDVDE